MPGSPEPVAPAVPPDAGVRWAPGVVVDGHRLLARIGSGGSGEVWRARDAHGRGDVALKRLVAGAALSPDAAGRLRREAESAGRLSSPHIVPVYGTGESGGSVYIVLRLVPDGDLAALLRERPAGLAPVHAARVVSQLAHALDAAHGRGLVHRDVKPANVLVERTPAGDVVQLGDFGLAVDTGTPDTGRGAGTGAYRAPETSAGGRVTGAVDVYALGGVLVELLTGRPAFPGPDRAAFRHQHEHDTPLLPGSVSPSLSPFDAVVARALAKRPEDRFPSAGALAAAASRAAATIPDGERPPHPATRSDPGRLRTWWRGRSRRVRALLALVAVVAVGGAGWTGYDLVTGPVPVTTFSSCVAGLRLPVTTIGGAGGPSYRIGTEPGLIGVTFYGSESAAQEQLDFLRTYAPLPGAGSEVVARRVVVTWRAEADPATVAAVRDCV